MKRYTQYGYARKTSKDREAENQLKAIREAGISSENIYVDQPIEKEKLRRLADRIHPGDVLVIKSLCQLGYNYTEILDEWTELSNKLGAHIRVLDIELDTSIEKKHIGDSFVSDLFQQIISFVAQQERDHIKRKQADGIAYAKSIGKHLGRPRIPKPLKFNDLYDMWRAGVISADEAMRRLNLKRSTFERFV